MVKKLLLIVGVALAPVLVHANGLGIQNYGSGATNRSSQPGFVTRQQPANTALDDMFRVTPGNVPTQRSRKPYIPYGPPPWYEAPTDPVAARQEYKGFQGRTAIEAFYVCRFDAMRSALPGEPSKSVTQKVRIRTAAMDICMNREGFFPIGGRNPINTEMISIRDFLW